MRLWVCTGEKRKEDIACHATRWSTMDSCEGSMNDPDHYYARNNWGTGLWGRCGEWASRYLRVAILFKRRYSIE